MPKQFVKVPPLRILFPRHNRGVFFRPVIARWSLNTNLGHGRRGMTDLSNHSTTNNFWRIRSVPQ